jgi:hypothetical protein
MSILVPLAYKGVPSTSIILLSHLNNNAFSNTLLAEFIVTILIVNKGEITNVQDKDWKMEIVGNIVFGFLMLSLDTLSLKEFLPYILISNGTIGYMVGKLILRPFQHYKKFPLTP